MKLIGYLLFLLLPLLPLGIFIILKAIRLVRTGFAGQVLLEVFASSGALWRAFWYDNQEIHFTGSGAIHFLVLFKQVST